MVCFLLGALACSAQTGNPKQQADHFFYAQAYPIAIESYSDLLKGNALPDEMKKDVLYNLGYAYQQLGDYAKAESHFRELLEMGEPSGRNKTAYLYYAQALGYNGKLTEAQEMYDRYEAVKATTLAPVAATYLNSSATNPAAKVTYRVENLALNTPNAEFSPAYFREGLVYVAGKGTSGASTSPDKGYLDLFYIPDRTAIMSAGTLAADGILTAVRTDRETRGVNPARRRLGRDAYTAPTANDSRSAATFAPVGFAEGLGLGARSDKSNKMPSAEAFSKELNTKYHEGPLTFSAYGSTVVFTRNNYNDGKSRKSSDNVNKLKLYTAQLRDGGWADVQEMPFNSDEYSTGHPALSRDGKVLYFVSDRPGGRGGTDVYVSRLENNKWSVPRNLGAPINTKGDEMFPFVDETGNLYFASNGQSGGLGGLDIYFAPLAGGDAPAIVHLDAPINSKMDDFGLITDASRSTGYFSSNRLNGDDDLFRFVRESSLFGCRNLTLRVFDEANSMPLDSVTVTVKARGEGRDPQVLAADANGMVSMCLEADNNFIFEIEKDGYLSGTLGLSTAGLTDDKSTQLGASLIKLTIIEQESLPSRLTTGTDDTEWENESTLTISTLRGTVTEEGGTKSLEGVKIILKNECNGQVKQTVTGSDGRFIFELVEGCDYTLVGSKPLYGTNTNAIKKIPEKSKPKLVSADLMMIKAGDVVTLDNINYDSGKWEVRPEAARELNKLVATMQKYPSLRIEIGSHTDSQGDAKFNQFLSERRAKSALNYLVSKGIARNRMQAKGYGESQLLNYCKDGVLCTEEEHQRNRRTEFKVLSIK